MSKAEEGTAAGAAEHRCVCSSLLARLRPEGVELRCRCCKRVVVIPWTSGARWHGVDVSWEPSESDD